MIPDFSKDSGLLPAVIQDAVTLEVLMLGFMNEEAYRKTVAEKTVTFYSRSKKRLWTKGETSGNFFRVVDIHSDCDADTILVKVQPEGPACHTGSRSCFNTPFEQNFIFELEKIIRTRYEKPLEGSYVDSLRKKGTNKIAQKVGEEATETVIAALNESREAFIGEASDLLFHLLVLLRQKELSLNDLAHCLERRHKRQDEQ